MTARQNRHGFISLDPMIFVVWFGLAAAMLVPLAPMARTLADAEGMGLGAAFWIEAKNHWIRAGLGGFFSLLCVGSMVLGILGPLVDTVRGGPADSGDAPGA